MRLCHSHIERYHDPECIIWLSNMGQAKEEVDPGVQRKGAPTTIYNVNALYCTYSI